MSPALLVQPVLIFKKYTINCKLNDNNPLHLDLYKTIHIPTNKNKLWSYLKMEILANRGTIIGPFAWFIMLWSVI